MAILKKVLFWNHYTSKLDTVSSSLEKVFGLGSQTIDYSLAKFGFCHSQKIKLLKSSFSSKRLVQNLQQHLTVLRSLSKHRSARLAELSKYGSKKSRRRTMGLPVNGQRTHSNSQTVRRLLRSKKKVFY